MHLTQYKKSQEYLKKAIGMMHCIDAVYTLSDVLVKTERMDEAIDLLESHAPNVVHENLHVKLGGLYMTKGEYENALRHYTTAVRYRLSNLA